LAGLQALWKAALIVLAIGVALMHSTGHACAGDVCPPESATVAMLDPHASMADDHGREEAPGSGMSPMQVCMAILTGLALAVSLWAIRRLARTIAAGDALMQFRRAVADIPVSLPPGGRLSYIELSVFRI